MIICGNIGHVYSDNIAYLINDKFIDYEKLRILFYISFPEVKA